MRDSEARSTRPRRKPAWTGFNRSDPGVTLLQLIALLVVVALGISWWRRRRDG